MDDSQDNAAGPLGSRVERDVMQRAPRGWLPHHHHGRVTGATRRGSATAGKILPTAFQPAATPSRALAAASRASAAAAMAPARA
jgi:hypothetical protein